MSLDLEAIKRRAKEAKERADKADKAWPGWGNPVNRDAIALAADVLNLLAEVKRLQEEAVIRVERLRDENLGLREREARA